MIEGIEELSETTVKEVMIPRIDVEFISIGDDNSSLLLSISELGFSRYPVYKETIDNVIGILYVKDLIKNVETLPVFSVKNIIRKPFFVPDSKKLDDLLREFKRRKVHIAVAIDEYGGVSGIICLEDILEVIVGDIQDEFDDEKEDFVELGKGIYLCEARVQIDELNESLGLELPDEDFETLGGFVFELFGKIPESLEKISFKTDTADVDFIVQDIEGHKINTIKIIIRNN
ncbi:MAG: HlyC/CorC family transporter [Spirochaetales bacterium]|nr:HlyC/CorC family transporter [Spirochaetales bacterium]